MYFDTSGDARWRPTRRGSIIFSAFPHHGRCLDRLSSSRMSAFRNMPLEHHCCMVNLNQILTSSSKWRLEEKAKRTNLFKFVCRASHMVRVEPLAARKNIDIVRVYFSMCNTRSRVEILNTSTSSMGVAASLRRDAALIPKPGEGRHEVIYHTIPSTTASS